MAAWAGYADRWNPAYEGSWEQGQKIRFLTSEGEGMFSTVEEHQPYEFVSIHHPGIARNGREDTQSEGARRRKAQAKLDADTMTRLLDLDVVSYLIYESQ